MRIAWGLGWGLETKSGTFFQWGDYDHGKFKAFAMGSMQQRRASVVLTNGFHGMAIMPERLGRLECPLAGRGPDHPRDPRQHRGAGPARPKGYLDRAPGRAWRA
jgi:hypothetical protein